MGSFTSDTILWVIIERIENGLTCTSVTVQPLSILIPSKGVSSSGESGLWTSRRWHLSNEMTHILLRVSTHTRRTHPCRTRQWKFLPKCIRYDLGSHGLCWRSLLWRTPDTDFLLLGPEECPSVPTFPFAPFLKPEVHDQEWDPATATYVPIHTFSVRMKWLPEPSSRRTWTALSRGTRDGRRRYTCRWPIPPQLSSLSIFPSTRLGLYLP